MFKYLRNRVRKLCAPPIPKSLDEALDQIIAKSIPTDLEAFRQTDSDCPGMSFHFSGGMAMRNNWNLWGKTGPLNNWFREVGIWHADDKSAIIYKALWCRLNHVPFDIKAEARYYELFWAHTAGQDFDGEPLILTEHERIEIKKAFKAEEVRRSAGQPKRRRLSWSDVVHRAHPYGYISDSSPRSG